MINVRGIANMSIQAINPNTLITISVPDGYAVDPLTLRQIPKYNKVSGQGNVQALDGDELRQADALNIQGTMRSVYLYGALAGVIRPNQQPSAQLEFDNGGISGRWNVFKVFETWQNWCKVGVVYQSAIMTANFSATPVDGAAPLSVQFTDSSTGLITSWLWDFGDGNQSTEQSPLHQYTEAGTYTVKLTISNEAATDIETKTDYITVSENP
jgi:PKD repeat protein